MIINRDTVVLRISCLTLLIGVDNQSQLVACLYGVVVRLEIYGVVMVFAIFQLNFIRSRCRCRTESCARVCKVDPAACNNLVLRLDSLEVDDLIILRTTADPVHLTGLNLSTAHGIGRKFIVCYINEHCAHHQCITAAGALALYCDCRCSIIRILICRIHDLFVRCTARSDCRSRFNHCRCLLIRMLNRCRADLYLNSALNHRIVRYRLSGIHCTCAGRTTGEGIAPVADTVHVAVDSGCTGCGIRERQFVVNVSQRIRGRPAV